MATKHVSDYPSSPTNDDSDDEGQESVDSSYQEEEDIKPTPADVSDVLKRISSSVIFKKPKQEYHCFTCSEDFLGSEELNSHLIQHVTLPLVVVDKLPSDDEETPPSGDENWSDEDEVAPHPQSPKTPQKIDISQILKKTGLSLKIPTEPDKTADSALNKLSGLGFTIKKNNTPIKKEPELDTSNELMQKLGKLGGIKLKLKSDGNNANSFKVINGLKDFNASDDENAGSENDDSKEDVDLDEDHDKSGQECSNDSEGERGQSTSASCKNSESDDSEKSPMISQQLTDSIKNLKGQAIVTKLEPKTPPKAGPARMKEAQTPPKSIQQARQSVRPVVKQTPKRVFDHEYQKSFDSQIQRPTSYKSVATPTRRESSTESRESISDRRDSISERRESNSERRESISERRQSNIQRRESHDKNIDNVVVKQEVEAVESQSSNIPIFSGHIKSERTSPTPHDNSTPVLARIKTEPDLPPPRNSVTTQNNQSIPPITPLLPVAKKEDTSMTIIEINGDSNDEDDDCCVVSATPAPDVKPKTEFIPKIENSSVSYPPSSYPNSQTNFGSNNSSNLLSNMLSNRVTAPSTEKQHNFNWNAPDSKPPLDILEKSADDIFESLLSNSTKKESMSISDASEYISLDTLGPQHTCDVCNTRFTDTSLLEEHRRMTGHTKSIVPVSASTLLPYNPASNLLSSLLPVKQLADQVGKLSTIGGSGTGFTHQQNVMINIQAYPGAGGVLMPQQPYNAFQPGQNMPPDFSQVQNNMYGGTPGQTMPGQYPGQNYMGPPGYGQYQSPMKSGYPGANQYPPSSLPYSSASPLQSMQQAVYGQASTNPLNTQIGQMGPPGTPYMPASSPSGSMKPPSSGVKIQNVQTFPPGQVLGGPMMPGQTHGGPDMGGQSNAPGQIVGGQMPSPSQIRMAPNANITGTRPRMATPRGPRPSIRPGIQVHGQVRTQKPGIRMPMKRPAGMPGGPIQKRRPDMLLPGKHDNEDCQVMAMQKQRDGLPMIHSVQGAKDKLNLSSQISITKKTVNNEANAMANVLASRGISVKQKQKSRSPTPERPVPHIPNLGAGVSIKHTSKSSNFSIPEAKVGGGMLSCKICKKMFMNHNSLSVHMSNAHPQSKLPVFKCDECPASYPKSLQLQHHKRVFHNISGPKRELGLPVVDLSQEDNLKRLSSLGIYSFIPLANREQANGCFGIPVISVHNVQHGLTTSLQALGADGLLSLGPLKPLPNS